MRRFSQYVFLWTPCIHFFVTVILVVQVVIFFAETRAKIVDMEAKVSMFESNMDVILNNMGELTSFLRSDGVLIKAELNSMNAQLSLLNDNLTSLAPLLRSAIRSSNPNQLPTVPLR